MNTYYKFDCAYSVNKNTTLYFLFLEDTIGIYGKVLLIESLAPIDSDIKVNNKYYFSKEACVKIEDENQINILNKLMVFQ